MAEETYLAPPPFANLKPWTPYREWSILRRFHPHPNVTTTKPDIH
jgi:hypothetical protein